MRRLYAVCVLVSAVMIASSVSASPKLNQLNDFESAGTSGWTNGSGAPDPVNVTTGGPLGTGDNFLRVTSRGGSGAGSRLVVFNASSQWTGNWLGTLITGVEMDLKNFGTTPLSMRIAFKDTYASKTAFTLPADSQWHHAFFNITEPDLTKLGSRNYTQALSAVTQFRILDAVTPNDEGAIIASSFGVDNVQAVPEPGIGMCVAGLAIVLFRWRRV